MGFEVQAHRVAFGGIRLPPLGMDDLEARRGAVGDEFVEREVGRSEVHRFAEELVNLAFTVAFVR